MNQQPQFEHDCDVCTFLGRSDDGTADLYSCKTDDDVELISRYSDEPRDNRSWALSITTDRNHPHTQEAAKKHIALIC